MKLDFTPRRCPNLGDRQGGHSTRDYPTTRNVCLGRRSRERRFLRVILHPYTPVPGEWQKRFCLGEYTKCPYFKEFHSGNGSAPGGAEGA